MKMSRRIFVRSGLAGAAIGLRGLVGKAQTPGLPGPGETPIRAKIPMTVLREPVSVPAEKVSSHGALVVAGG